jgi:hypothetical protein
MGYTYVATPLDFARTPVASAAALRSPARTTMKCCPSGWASLLTTLRSYLLTK